MLLLIGHGYVGRYVSRVLTDQGIDHDWMSHQEVLMTPNKYDFIINAAGHTGTPNVDACEVQRVACLKGNVQFPLNLHAHFDCPILHITSGCVYTGYTQGGWMEYDKPNFNMDNGSFYSGTKALFQEMWEDVVNDQGYLFRIRMPFGADNNDKNLLTKLRKYPKLVNFENSVSNVEDVAKAAVFFYLNRPNPGIYNVCNPGSVTTYQIAEMLRLDKEWYDHDAFMEAVRAPRSNCVLNTDKIMSVYPLERATESLYKCVKFLDSIPL